MPIPRSIKNSAAPVILLAAFLLFAFYDVTFLGKTFKATTANSQALTNGVYGQENNRPRWIPVNGTDAPVSEEPFYEFIKQNLRRGILPLWNPHQACGFALIGMLEVGMFYPLNLILYLLPNTISWDVLIFARLFLAGLFTFFFMRHLGYRKTPSLCAALVFMLSGPMTLLQYWTANVDLLTPLLFISLDKLLKETNRRSVAMTALVVAATLFAGHPEHVFLVNFYGLVFFVFRFLTLKPTTPISKIVLSYGLSYILGIGLAAIVFFPFVRNFHGEFWHGHPDGTGLLMEEQRDRVLSLALPYFFQKQNLTYDFTFAGWWGGYLGTLPLAFASLALFKKQNNGLNYFFAVMAFLIIGKAYGLPIINWLGYLPLFDTCRYAIHTPPLACLTVAILCGMGVSLLREQKDLFKKGLPLTLGLLSIVGLHLWILREAKHFSISLNASLFALAVLTIFQIVLWVNDRALLKPKVRNGILVAIIFLELFSYIHRERPRRFDSFAKVPYIEFLRNRPEISRSYGLFWAFYPNTATGFMVDDLGYFLGLVPQRYVTFVNSFLREGHFKNDLRPPSLRATPIERANHPILDLLNVRYFIVPSETQLKKLLRNSEKLFNSDSPIYNDEVRIYERPSALPRAFIVHRAVFEPDEQKLIKLMQRLGPALREGAAILYPRDNQIIHLLNGLPVSDQSTVKILSLQANEVVLEANMENPGFVVLSDAYHPDWRADIDGKSTQVYQTNYLLRSVFVPAGQHTIKFSFIPLSFYAGAVVSLASFLILLFLFRKKTNQIA